MDNSSSRPRRAAAIKADERIQQIHNDDTDQCLYRRNQNSPRILSSCLDENNHEPVELLIDQMDALHIERKLTFDDDG